MDGLFCRYDIGTLEKELEVGTEDIAALFSSYISEMGEDKGNMLDALSAGDWEALGHIVHNIKGVSANLYINDVYQLAMEFDLKLKARDIQHSKGYVEKLMQLLQDAEVEIRKYFSERGFSL